ncbi:hypothetical protein Bca52824_040922 [Brassica carinata]|uniref:Uncharacterized protein n=1 Tax=Brassica carinata TaxID=52824 RepID=A0A8X7RUC1_BRACI|nr:hypothetical protein Bca52824_040922 [Brassica carinata]
MSYKRENQTHFNIAGIKKSSANSVSKAAKIKGRLLKRLKMSLRDLNLGSSPLLRRFKEFSASNTFSTEDEPYKGLSNLDIY